MKRTTTSRCALVALGALTAVLACTVTGCRTAQPTDFRDVVLQAKEKVFPSLVYVRVVCKDLDGGKDGKHTASGSGVVITEDGELLTNHHVIDKAVEIRCLLSDGTSYDAKVLGSDKDMDVALLKLQMPEGAQRLHAAALSSEPVNVGDVVLAMGAPWGLARSVTMGIVSCTDRYLEKCGQYTLWYQTDAAISPGNSGGPLVDTAGRVVGLNARGNLMGAQAFTIPSPTILEVLPYLREKGNANWSWFGFQFQPLHDFNRNTYFPFTNGVIVAGTEIGSPARKAGFKVNDRIVAVDGVPVTALNAEDLPALERRLGRFPVGKAVKIDYARGGETLSASVAPREKGKVEGAEKVYPRWGFTAKEINRFNEPELAFFAPSGGVYVAATAWEGNAATSGLKSRDIVKSMDGKKVETLEDLDALYKKALDGLPVQDKMSVTVDRKGREFHIILKYREDTEKDDLQ